MSRLHRKCLVASAAVHGLLLLVLVVGPAFRDAPPEPMEYQQLEIIPNRIVDLALSGGGDPDAGPPPVQAPVQVPVVAPAPTPEPEPLRRVPEPIAEPKPQPQPRERAPTPEPKPKVAEPKPAASKPKIVVAPIKPQSATTRRQSVETGVPPNVAEDLRSRFSSTASRLGGKLTPKTFIGVPGPGGEAFANYSQVVISIYQQQWLKPIGIEQAAIVKATVVIARDGQVVSTRITKLSGNRTVDESVERVLQRVKTVARFPEGATDTTRTFDLSFELTPADLSG
jgi:protein TonB